MSATLTWHDYPTPGELDAALADFVAAKLNAALATKGSATIAFSGGRTPTGFLRTLGQHPLDWARILITLADERQVPEDHPDSNARLLRETLLSGAASAAQFIPLYSPAGQPEVEASLGALPWPLDVVVLGMGDDGHTASLFPQAPQLAHACQTEDRCAAITPVTAAHERLTLSLHALASTHNLIVHITGSNKRQLFKSALEPSADKTDEPLPIRRVLTAHPVPTHVFWAP